MQSLDRGISILEAVAKSTGPVPLGELTDILGIDRSSVSPGHHAETPRISRQSQQPEGLHSGAVDLAAVAEI